MQVQCLLRQRRKMDVADVDGIERAAKEADVANSHKKEPDGWWWSDDGKRNHDAVAGRGDFHPLPWLSLPTASGVIDAFQILGLVPRLVLSSGELGDAFREAGKLLHPDAGGSEGEFARLREAQAVLASPSRRLRLWWELRGGAIDLRGTIDSDMMDLFADVGAVTQQAEAVIRQRDEAKSALVRAMIEPATQLAREAVENALALVDARIAAECDGFAELETTAQPEVNAVSRTARNLAFLEKWRVSLRGCYSRLV